MPGTPRPARTEGALVPAPGLALGFRLGLFCFFKNDFQGQQEGKVLSVPALGEGFGGNMAPARAAFGFGHLWVSRAGFCEPCWVLPPVSAPAGL